MIGHAKKFEPGLLKYYKEKEPRRGNMLQKEIFENFANLTHSKQSFSQAMDLRKSNMVAKMKQMRKARRELLYHHVESADQGNANKTAANWMKRANNAKSMKKFATGLIGLEQIAKLYEICPEVPISTELAKHFENRSFG